MAKEREYADHQQEHGADVLPAEAPINARTLAQHLLDVVAEVVDAIEPEHTGRLDEDDEKNSQSGPVNVKELHQIHATLEEEGKEEEQIVMVGDRCLMCVCPDLMHHL